VFCGGSTTDQDNWSCNTVFLQAMTAPPPSCDRIADALLAMLLQDAVRDLALAFGRANKTAALFTLAAIEHELVARAEAFPGLLASPRVTHEATGRVIARISSVLADVQRAVEDISIQ
jgi:hypothetical protein